MYIYFICCDQYSWEKVEEFQINRGKQKISKKQEDIPLYRKTWQVCSKETEDVAEGILNTYTGIQINAQY